MSMKGRFPILRTLQYLGQGDIVFKESVKVMTVNYNTHGELGEGARKFVFFNIPQIQYKNPWVQIMMFKNMTPTPFLRFYLDSGEQVLVDVETKSNKEIMEHIKKILGKNEKVCVASGHHTKEWLHWEDAEGMVPPAFSLKFDKREWTCCQRLEMIWSGENSGTPTILQNLLPRHER
ncbi:28S ribosomal protein S25, mitochondrial isoform X1 [Orcinus orca]|uniref:Small ribosomal subunit protein mS25 n=1 Tax=Tursiops truncatus TaxID=9739 RepID=A0A2U4B7W5_TURTR|nr:28S ribosomal protein S25, mitochondrial isoform X1 [Tursiops truncatus]XP_026949672.1 28S ribosomal protein S25, mitochondrial isoform X1 [Lagenorhynchus obliquidens]XP_030696741.1 small ribosomal subunit protein mS25 isoform X1 [Globicephala melas]XP_033269994.1 28S ribosomal protein S25, mitochondrial isoform X1 [Orcinus orca]